MLRGYYRALKSFTADPFTDAIMKSTSPRQNVHLRNSRFSHRCSRRKEGERFKEKKRKQRQ
jgi:hypothetical protein